jgi:hypothetical protein
MWAVEKSFFKWKYKHPGRPENFYLKMVLRTRYFEKPDDFVFDIAQRCRTLDDAIIEAVRVDFGESVARKFKPAFELFPPCSMCGRYRALSTHDTLCYGCREFGHLIPCHKCHLYWDLGARLCRNCGSPLVPRSGTEVNQAGTSPTANSDEQEPSNDGEDPPTNPPAGFPSVPLPRSAAFSDELVNRAVTLAVAGIWKTVTEHDISATILDVVRALAEQRIRPEELVYRIFRPVQTALMAQRAAKFLSIQLDPAFSTFAQQNLERLYAAYLGEGEAGFRRAWSSIFRSGWELHRPTESIVVCEGGDGRTEEGAIVLKPGDENPETAVAAEYWYLLVRFRAAE